MRLYRQSHQFYIPPRTVCTCYFSSLLTCGYSTTFEIIYRIPNLILIIYPILHIHLYIYMYGCHHIYVSQSISPLDSCIPTISKAKYIELTRNKKNKEEQKELRKKNKMPRRRVIQTKIHRTGQKKAVYTNLQCHIIPSCFILCSSQK